LKGGIGRSLQIDSTKTETIMDEAIAAAAMSVVMIVTDGSERRHQRIRPLQTTDENNNIRLDTKEGSEWHELQVDAAQKTSGGVRRREESEEEVGENWRT
jgi:hypothetical protein